ncbi:hypothetical protein M9Y10_018647 [Tritrichomonas musculus]|uniref:SGF29 C-terminal domain-containing protein n=1 Tax=Tritrichomonas musculus TaxID=1915356 RepID=A0ABR2HNB5_9EUKA
MLSQDTQLLISKDQLKSINEHLTSCDKYIKQLTQIHQELSDEILKVHQNTGDSITEHPNDLEEARKAGQKGDSVIIYPPNANGKHAAFKVTENNDLSIDGMLCMLTKIETKDSLTNIRDQKLYDCSQC